MVLIPYMAKFPCTLHSFIPKSLWGTPDKSSFGAFCKTSPRPPRRKFHHVEQIPSTIVVCKHAWALGASPCTDCPSFLNSPRDDKVQFFCHSASLSVRPRVTGGYFLCGILLHCACFGPPMMSAIFNLFMENRIGLWKCQNHVLLVQGLPVDIPCVLPLSEVLDNHPRCQPYLGRRGALSCQGTSSASTGRPTCF